MEDLELRAAVAHERHAILVQAKHLPAGVPRRGGEGAPLGETLRGVDRGAGRGVVAGEEAAVEEDPQLPVGDERGRVVGGGAGLAPDDELVGGRARGERDVAGGPRLDGVDRLARVENVAAAHVEEAVGLERRGDRDARHPLERPEEGAIETVAADRARAGSDDLGAQRVFPDEGGAPVALLVACGLPLLRAGGGVEGHDLRLLLVVVDDVQHPLVEGRRGGGAPAEAHRSRRERPVPDDRAVEIEAPDADAAEHAPHVRAVGDGGLRGVAALDVDRRLRDRLVHLFLPAHLPGSEIEAHHLPLVHALGGLLPLATEIEPLLRFLGVAGVDDGGEEHTVAGDDRRRPAAAGDVALPGDVVGGAPAVGRERGAGGDPPGPGAAELRPGRLGAGGGGQRHGQDHGSGPGAVPRRRVEAANGVRPCGA